MILTWNGRLQTEDALKDMLEAMDEQGTDEHQDLSRYEAETALLSITMRPIKEHANIYIQALRHRLSHLENSRDTTVMDEEDEMYFDNEISEVEQAIENLEG